MIFLESSLDFPDEWYLQPLFFLFPIVGLGAIADSVIRLAFLMFTRKQNQPEWNRMLASLCRNHVVVVGVGRVGYQVIKELLELRESVVAIEQVERGRAPRRALRQEDPGHPGQCAACPRSSSRPASARPRP